MNKGVEKLNKYMDSKGVKQIDVARAAGMGADVMCHILKGRRRPTLDQAIALQAATKGAVLCTDWVPQK